MLCDIFAVGCSALATMGHRYTVYNSQQSPLRQTRHEEFEEILACMNKTLQMGVKTQAFKPSVNILYSC